MIRFCCLLVRVCVCVYVYVYVYACVCVCVCAYMCVDAHLVQVLQLIEQYCIWV